MENKYTVEYFKKKRKRKIIRRSISFVIIVSLLGAYFIKVKPIVNNGKEIVYDKLSNINEDTFAQLENTKVYNKDKKLIGEINSGNYSYTSIGNISKYIQDGYIAVEDNNFKSHNGVDLYGTARAGLNLILNRGKITQGGSTITQQLVKNAFLTQQKTYKRKMIEMLLARQIEKKYTKADIMEYYCNSNYYANRCYGVGNACSYYFNKKPKEISLSQAALLIGISNNPSAYDPVSNYANSIKKRDRVLQNMLSFGSITKTQYKNAVNEKIKIVKYRKNHNQENYETTYALHQATIEMMTKDGFSFQYTFKDKAEYKAYKKKYSSEYANTYQKLRNGGYKIYTYFDSKLQDDLQNSVDSTLKGFHQKKKGKFKMQGAAVSIDNETGNIVAVVGGRGKDDEYNRAYLAARQPGSSIKPLIVYTPAFDSGLYYPSKAVSDKKAKDGPSNSNKAYSGSINVREAIVHSVNTVAWNILQKIGPSNGLDYLGQMQFSNISYLDKDNASLALGGFTYGLTVSDMAKGYATVENNGVYRNNSCISSITYKDKNYITHKNTKKEVYTSSAAYMTTDCMTDAVKRGTGKEANVKDCVIAGKTGTTNSYKDAWFCGFSGYYTTAVWVGYDKPTPVDGLTGGSYPAKIFKKYMATANRDKPKKKFAIPETIEVRGDELFAKKINDKIKKSILEIIQEEQKKSAEKAVEKFEAFCLNDIDDALSLENKHDSVLKKIDFIDDDYAKGKLNERVSTHYEKLQKEYQKWEKAIASHDKAEEEERIAKNNKAQKEAMENRESYEKTNNINLVEAYITNLNAVTSSSVEVETAITEAQTALEACADYPEYDDLSTRLEKAVSYARDTMADNQAITP